MNPKLSEKDQQIILQCMKCIYEGDYIENPEFSTRIAMHRPDFKKVLDAYPNVDDSVRGSNAYLAVNNALNEVCNGIEIPDSEWNDLFSVNPEKVRAVYKKWSLNVGQR